MENKTLSVTDEIYAELVDGLKTGLDWTHFLAKHSASKGPLYNAIGRFFHDMEPKVKALAEVQAKLDQAGLELDSLDQKRKEVDKAIQAKNHDLALLEEKGNTLKKQIAVLEGDLQQKGELLERGQELEKLGFGKEKLAVLHTTLAEIGSKRGLKRNEAVDTFFAELKDYDAIRGFSQELQRLDAIISTKSLQAEKWKVEAETCERRHKELQGAISAIQSLSKQGVKPEQVVSWSNTLTSIGGVEELEKGLGRYRSVQGLLVAKRGEQQRSDAKLAKSSGAVKTLKEQKVELEESIRTLRVSALKEIERLSQVSVEKISGVAQAGTNSIGQVGETALGELKEALSLVDRVCARALEAGKIVGQIEGKLDKSKETMEKTAALVTGIEGGR